MTKALAMLKISKYSSKKAIFIDSFFFKILIRFAFKTNFKNLSILAEIQ
jgi:hypothetical protein